jgi:hypothetical protein
MKRPGATELRRLVFVSTLLFFASTEAHRTGYAAESGRNSAVDPVALSFTGRFVSVSLEDASVEELAGKCHIKGNRARLEMTHRASNETLIFIVHERGRRAWMADADLTHAFELGGLGLAAQHDEGPRGTVPPAADGQRAPRVTRTERVGEYQCEVVEEEVEWSLKERQRAREKGQVLYCRVKSWVANVAGQRLVIKSCSVTAGWDRVELLVLTDVRPRRYDEVSDDLFALPDRAKPQVLPLSPDTAAGYAEMLRAIFPR